ncbi:MAG: hypothetical protein GEU90_01355 [Gemmatimonas sp.]|nr:hypothetical protein [Gemmatimonas sp.]
MKCARSVLLILVLLAGSLSPPPAGAQEAGYVPQPEEEQRDFVLEQNYPNPVNPETWIPFSLDPSLYKEDQPVTVTIRVFNILGQSIAIPEAVEHPNGRGTRILNLEYAEPGRKIAFWDGKDTASRPVPSGVYYLQMVVGGETQTRKLTVLNPRNRRRIFPW